MKPIHFFGSFPSHEALSSATLDGICTEECVLFANVDESFFTFDGSAWSEGLPSFKDLPIAINVDSLETPDFVEVVIRRANGEEFSRSRVRNEEKAILWASVIGLSSASSGVTVPATQRPVDVA